MNFRRYVLEKGQPLFEDGTIGVNCRDGGQWRDFVEECKRATPNEMIDGPFSQLYALYPRFYGEVSQRYNAPAIMDGELQNEWLWGDAGTGKTRSAWERYPGLYVKNRNKWWDGYNGEEVVLIDDWDPNCSQLAGYLKVWSDRYPFRAEVKGSSMMIRPKKIIITSNYSPADCFSIQDLEAIRRRFKVTHFNKPL